MTAQDLFKSGHLSEAIQALMGELRDKPADHRRRTFLFELLCINGEFERASKHLGVLADESPDAQVGALVYRSALSASQKREKDFKDQNLPKPAEALARPGRLNGEPFKTITDCDPRIGPRLEMFAAGEYIWLPFEHLGTIAMEPPKFLRDTVWPTAYVTAGPSYGGREFGEVLLPVLYPSTFTHADNQVKLGRETVWTENDIPYGQKLLLLDDERVVPYLEIRSLSFDAVNEEDVTTFASVPA